VKHREKIPLDFLFTNRTIYKPSRAKDRWAKHELIKMNNAKALTKGNDNILEELAGLNDEELKIIEEDANGETENKEIRKIKSDENLN